MSVGRRPTEAQLDMFVFWKIVGDALALGVVAVAFAVTRGVFRH